MQDSRRSSGPNTRSNMQYDNRDEESNDKRKRTAGGSYCFALIALAVFIMFAIILIALCSSILVKVQGINSDLKAPCPSAPPAGPSCPAQAAAGETSSLDELVDVPPGEVVISVVMDFQDPNAQLWYEQVLPDLTTSVAGTPGYSIQFIPIRFVDFLGTIRYPDWQLLPPSNNESLVLGAAFLCAAVTGRQQDFGGQLFANQQPMNSGYWTNKRVIDLMKGLGYPNFDKFKTCVTCGSQRAQVLTDMAAVEMYTSAVQGYLSNGNVNPTPFVLTNQYPLCTWYYNMIDGVTYSITSSNILQQASQVAASAYEGTFFRCGWYWGGLSGIPLNGQDDDKTGQAEVGQEGVGQPNVGQTEVGQPNVGQTEIGQRKVGQDKSGQAKVNRASKVHKHKKAKINKVDE